MTEVLTRNYEAEISTKYLHLCSESRSICERIFI